MKYFFAVLAQNYRVDRNPYINTVCGGPCVIGTQSSGNDRVSEFGTRFVDSEVGELGQGAAAY
jgi:hypothetical protein